MFGNLKSKIGEAADLKKYGSPQSIVSSLTSSRVHSSQNTPGVQSPSQCHSRQSSIASNPGAFLHPSNSPDKLKDTEILELEAEIKGLRSSLESQRDSSVKQFAVKEQEWKAINNELKAKVVDLDTRLNKCVVIEHELGKKVANYDQLLEESHKLEAKVSELQENYDQLEGLSSQEVAKIKHMLLSTTQQLERSEEELAQRTKELGACERRLQELQSFESKISVLADEKTDLETQLAGMQQKLLASERCISELKSENEDEVTQLCAHINRLEKKISQGPLEESDKVLAIMKERDDLSHTIQETNQQLHNVKVTWSEKISSLESQIEHLNVKIAEDQGDFKRLQSSHGSLDEELKSCRADLEEKTASEAKALSLVAELEKEVEFLNSKVIQCQKDLESAVQSSSFHLKTLQEEYDAAKGEMDKKISILSETHEETLRKLASSVSELKEARHKVDMATEEVRIIEESLLHERAQTEGLSESLKQTEAKLETLLQEKAKLTHNLDEMVSEVSHLEKQLEDQTHAISIEIEKVTILEELMRNKESESETLQLKITELTNSSLEEERTSGLIIQLENKVRQLELEVNEKKQALKQQNQRMADMKKAFKKDFKLSSSPENTEMCIINHISNDKQNNCMAFKGQEINASEAAYLNGSCPTDPVNVEYLKHVILKFVTSREYEAVQLTRAIATLLHLTPNEEKLLKDTLEWKMSWFGTRPNLGKGQLSKTIPSSH